MTTEKLTDPGGVVTFEAGEPMTLVEHDGAVYLVPSKYVDRAAPGECSGSLTVTAVNRKASEVTFAGEPAPLVVHRDMKPGNRKARRAARKAGR